MKAFEFLPHTADIKLRVYGKTKQELFKHALQGMFAYLDPYISNDANTVHQEINIESYDSSTLLADFLSEALALSDIYNQAYLDIIIHELQETSLRATCLGTTIKGWKRVEIKAVTYNELILQQTADGWQADIVFDI